MTDLQRAQLRASEIRTRLAELGGMEALEDEHRSELDTLRNEYGDVERRIQALTIAEGAETEGASEEHGGGEESSEERELRQLVDDASAGEIVHAAITGADTDGATRELQEHFGLDSHAVPLAMLEVRAESNNTDAPAAGSRGASQAPIIPYVFPSSVSAFLSVPQPTVPVGERVYTVLSTALSAGTPALEADQAVGTAAFAAKSLSPGRIQAAFAYRIEDAATLRGMDSALRQNLSGALSDKLDERVIANLIADGQSVDASGAVVDFAAAVQQLYASVDGRYADEAGAVRMVFGGVTYQLLANAYRGTGTNETALQKLRADGGGVRVNANMPAVASKKQKSIFRVGSRMDAVAPIWEGVQIIVDRVTQAKAGQVIVTGVMLYAVDTLRQAPVRVVEFATAA